jgi:hypothetical protein
LKAQFNLTCTRVVQAGQKLVMKGRTCVAESISRRTALGLGLAGAAASVTAVGRGAFDDQPTTQDVLPARDYLTSGKDFGNVSRGDPLPYMLKDEALEKAGLTPETWRLEIVAEDKAKIAKPLRRSDGTALDLPGLFKIGQTKGVRFLKAMQCTNIAVPSGQGL